MTSHELLLYILGIITGTPLVWQACKVHIRRSLTVREDTDGAAGWRVFLGETPVGPLRFVRGNAEKDLEQHREAV